MEKAKSQPAVPHANKKREWSVEMETGTLYEIQSEQR